MPQAPDPDQLKSWTELFPDDEGPFVFWQNIEGRPLYPEEISGEPRAQAPVFREWFRFRPRATFDDPFVDAARMLVIIDTLSWPAAAQPHHPTSTSRPGFTAVTPMANGCSPTTIHLSRKAA